MSAADEWALRQLAEDDARKRLRDRRAARSYAELLHYRGLSFWGKVKHNLGFGERI